MKQTIEWHDAKTEKPETKEKVLIFGKDDDRDLYFIGFYIPPHTIPAAAFWDSWAYSNEGNDYDAAEDEYYVPDSWHQVNHYSPASWRVDMDVDIIRWARLGEQGEMKGLDR